MSGGHCHEPPPSAAGHLEPYGIRATLRCGPSAADARLLLATLLEGLAAECVAAGATVIGHLKCLLHLDGGTLACNLTSVRGGASCGAWSEGTPAWLKPGETARLDLAVLVYGLSADVIDGLVRARLSDAVARHGGAWTVDAAGDTGHRHP